MIGLKQVNGNFKLFTIHCNLPHAPCNLQPTPITNHFFRHNLNIYFRNALYLLHNRNKLQ